MSLKLVRLIRINSLGADMHIEDQKLVDSIRDSITEVAEKVEGLATNQRKLQVSLLALQIYVANGLHPEAAAQSFKTFWT